MEELFTLQRIETSPPPLGPSFALAIVQRVETSLSFFPFSSPLLRKQLQANGVFWWIWRLELCAVCVACSFER